MDRVFSVGDIADQFWSPAPPPAEDPKMNRSASEWAFERFLQEATVSTLSDTSSSKSAPDGDVVQIKDVQKANTNCSSQPQSLSPATTSFTPASGPAVWIDYDEYHALLKSKLNLACAAVALTRAPFVINQSSSVVADGATQGSVDSQSDARPPSKGSQDKDAGAPIGIPSLPSMQKKAAAQPKQTTSCSSRELSDDDEAEGENETTENMDPADVKRDMNVECRWNYVFLALPLSGQVSQLRVENSSLLKRLTDISQKYNEAAVDNRVLKADVETLRAKVKMAEESVKRVTGMNPLLQAMSEISALGMATNFIGSPLCSPDAAVPVQEPDPKHPHYYTPVINPLSVPPARVDNGMANISAINSVLQTATAPVEKIGRTTPLQRVASLEHLQKRIRGGVEQGSPHGSSGSGEQ
ncbi:hypothetical protein Cgig2_011691 [Carnegiea gigantea]|uniref:Basic leucine-zipper C-terminal domain-containing protein n=1 Tax=Carnegiea gigantea TaxID=171969 RepID=A0A9Q1JXM4_9CARY|nr:hypothetical protein Cgig2_011691 [Carnegiea gigantea]